MKRQQIQLGGPISWVAIACYLIAVIGFAWQTTPFSQLLAAVGIAGAFGHASLTYGGRKALVLAGICVSITFAVENIGVATGFPFGSYHFEAGDSLPHLGFIPLIVGPLWFGMGYFSWIVAATLLDGADARLGMRSNRLLLPVVAAFVMTQWDLVMDAPNATIAKAWIWHDGGAYFGVPISNYLGWLLTSWLFYQAFAIYLSRQDHLKYRLSLKSWRLRLVAILFYLSAGFCQITPWVLGEAGNAADGGGNIWKINDIREVSVVAFLFTMIFTSMLAMVTLFGIKSESNE